MKYTEVTLYKKIHDVFPGFIKRVENQLEVGTPDVYFAYNQVSGWMELKCKRVEGCRGKVVIPFQPGQYAWLREHTKQGGLSVLALWGRDAYYFVVGAYIQMEYESFEDFKKHAVTVEVLTGLFFTTLFRQ